MSPATWASKYPLAGGTRQSPVNIDTRLAQSDSSLADEALTWKYGLNHAYRIVNTGYGWRVDTNGQDTELKGGPLTGVYKLEQFHCHWGSSCDQGSEHTVDGKSYAAELHLVHWNCEKYSSFGEAASQPDGLAVLGVFLQVGDGEEKEELQRIASLIPEIEHKGQSTDIDFEINLNNLLPADPHYWTYLGSLTTPPCNESVIWIVFKDSLDVSEEQLNVFRTMKSVGREETNEPEQCLLRSNYRPPLPLGNRVLRECGSI
ncbi:carbonic anhydrase 1 isoform X3 [Rhodnius prolixus]|uniref:carbonic anhydrase 1 isoform X3 n=1 Tax=Rhodnius prolixus TaxID=13249 RepID=UPI003D189E9C